MSSGWKRAQKWGSFLCNEWSKGAPLWNQNWAPSLPPPALFPKKPNRNSNVGWHSVEHSPLPGEIIHQLLEGKEVKPASFTLRQVWQTKPTGLGGSREPEVKWAVAEPYAFTSLNAVPPTRLTLAKLDFHHFHSPGYDSQSLHHVALAGIPESAHSPHGWLPTSSLTMSNSSWIQSFLLLGLLPPLWSHLLCTCSALFTQCPNFPQVPHRVTPQCLCSVSSPLPGRPKPFIPQSRSHSTLKSYLT